jgi:hypothetical protein
VSDDPDTSAQTSADTEKAPARPLLRVVRGELTAEELAALVAVLAARSGGEPAPVTSRSPWGRPGIALRNRLEVHTSAWRESGLRQGVRTRADW